MRRLSRAPFFSMALALAAGIGLPACRSARAHDEKPNKPAETPVIASPLPSATAAPSASAVAGVPDAGAVNGPCPDEMTKVGKTCVDRWEAHLEERLPDGNARAHPHNQRPEKGVSYFARSEAGVFPQAYVNRNEASSACQAAGKRLCTLGEWYRACRGPKGTIYPYGANESKTKCNTGKPHLLSKLFGTDPHKWDYMTSFNAPELDVEPGGLAKTAEYAECTNDWGTFDMVGNLHEWVSDIVDDDLEKKIPLREDIQRKIPVNWGHAIFMGGFFSTTSEHGPGCQFLTPGHEAAYHDYSTGFRCCKDAKKD